MQLVVHLNSLNFINDFLDMGVNVFVVGSTNFSTRQALSLEYKELKNLVNKIKSSAKIYVLVNALIEEKHLDELHIHLSKLNEIGIEGILFQDFGVLNICKKNNYQFDLMYAPDTLNTNQETLKFLSNQGITSSFLAREIPLNEKQDIQKHVNIPCMIQAHGVEYMAYSKRNLLTNYFKTTSKVISPDFNSELTIKANNIDDSCHIYEDKYGTHILTNNQICCLDVLHKLIDFNYLFIESLYINAFNLVEITYLYKQAIDSIYNNTYDKEVKELMPLLNKLEPSVKYYHGFMFDQTVYRIADVRKREEDESN